MHFRSSILLIFIGISPSIQARESLHEKKPIIRAIENFSDFIIHCIAITSRTKKGIYQTHGVMINPGTRACNLDMTIEENKPVVFTIIDGKSRPIVLYNNEHTPNLIETVCIKNGQKEDLVYIPLDSWRQKLEVRICENLELFFSPSFEE